MTREEAQKRARDLIAVLGGSVPNEMFDAITDAFMSCARAELERLSGFATQTVDSAMEQVEKAGKVSGITNERVPPTVTIPYGRLRTIINGVMITKAARVEVDAEFAAKYPEHARFEAGRPEWNAVYAFLIWLKNQKLTICEPHPGLVEYLPIAKTPDMILDEHFGFDKKLMDDEKRAMLIAFQQRTEQEEPKE